MQIWVGLFLIGVSLAAAPSGARAQVVQLAELEAHALRARPGMGANDARIAQARARVEAARSAYSPTISFIADAALAPGGKVIELPGSDGIFVSGSYKFGNDAAFTPRPRYSGTLDVRGNLYDFGRTSAAIDAARAGQRAAEADAHRANNDIVRDVRAAYVRWATAYALWSLSANTAEAAAKRAQQTAASIEEGARPSADRLAAESEAAFADLELERARATLDDARDDLGFLCVTDLPENAKPADEVLQRGLVPIDGSKNAGDPTLRALQEQGAAARAAARVHDKAFVPVISAQAQAGLSGTGLNAFPLYRVGLNVTVPLWDGGADAAHRSEAEAQAAELAAEATQYQQQRTQAQHRSETARAQAARRIDIAQKLVDVNRQRVAQLEEGYPLGAATLAQLADARTSLSRAQTELVLAQAMRAEALLGVQ
jgi:outer membrane protein TolC